MGKVFKYFVFIFILLLVRPAYSEDTDTTMKQQLDRLQREVSDLSKTVYTGARDTQIEQKDQSQTSSDLSAFDIKIYELEKVINELVEQTNQSETSFDFLPSTVFETFRSEFDLTIYDLKTEVKKLNEDVEELVFKIDDLKILLDELTLKLDTKFTNNQEEYELDQATKQKEINNEENNSKVSEDSLGNLTAGSNDVSDENDGFVLKKNVESNINVKLTPDQEFQQAFNLTVSRQYDEAKISFKKFIDNNKDHFLAGPAHYWLGKISISKKEYREAALVLAEGYQKYPNSEKAPDILYELSESLVKIDKKTEACSTIKKLSTEYPGHKLLDKSQDRISELGCNIAVE